VNVKEIGYYRVNYDLQNWNRLADVLNSDRFSIIEDVNRAQIIDDAFNLARAGYLDYETAFDLSKYLVRETNYLPWKAYLNAMAYVGQRIQSRPDIKHLYVRHTFTLLNKIYKKLGFKENMETDSLLDQLTRDAILNAACKYGYKDCLEQSKIYFAKSR
jgi:aminopeptidase N